MSKSEDIRKELDLSVLGLQNKMIAFNHINRLFELFDRPDFPMFVGYATPDGHWSWVNQAFSNFLGKPKEEIYKAPWTEFIADADKDEVVALYIKKLKSNEVYDNEPTPYYGSDGAVHILDWTTSEIHPEDTNENTVCVAPIPNTYKNR